MKAIAIGGEPATGKSTLVSQLLGKFGAFEQFEFGELFGRIYTEPDPEMLLFGEYGEEDFGGTDRLPMSVQPHAEKFVELAAEEESEYSSYTILFEGDRLFTGSFLSHLSKTDNVTLYPILLTASEHILEERHATRGDTQSEDWLKGRRSKYKNIGDEWGTHPNFQKHTHDTREKTDEVVNAIQRKMQ